MVSFNEPWYHEMIARFSPPSPGDDDIGGSLLVAACLIAQAIDEHTKEMRHLASAVGGIAEALSNKPT